MTSPASARYRFTVGAAERALKPGANTRWWIKAALAGLAVNSGSLVQERPGHNLRAYGSVLANNRALERRCLVPRRGCADGWGWTHLALTWNGTEINVYVDGVLVATPATAAWATRSRHCTTAAASCWWRGRSSETEAGTGTGSGTSLSGDAVTVPRRRSGRAANGIAR